ncbi:hypothetical protein THAOC_11528, partial [Thalassiosira oceanica]
DRYLLGEEGNLNLDGLRVMIAGYPYPFHECRKLSSVKLSVSRALFERMERLPPECRLSVLGRVRNLPRLELMQDGTILACFPVVSMNAKLNVQDTNLETARSLHRVLQLIAFHELKEASIVIDLAMWKSIDRGQEGTDCRVLMPDPAKGLIMEYFGLTGCKPAL